MRKIFAFALALMLSCSVFIVSCLAFGDSTEAETVPDVTSSLPIEDETLETSGSTSNNTLFSRIWEYCVNNKRELIVAIGDGLLLFLGLCIKLSANKRNREIQSDIMEIKGDTSGTASSQVSVVDAVNNMIGGYNDMRASYDKTALVEDDRNRLVGASVVLSTAVLDIMTSVYINSKNLPQGTKDLITLRYANCQKALADDELLRQVVDAVHEKLGGDALRRLDEDVPELNNSAGNGEASS